MRKRTLTTLGTLVLFAAVLLVAWRGSFGYLEITALGVVLGLPSVIGLVRLYLTKDARDASPDRPD